MILLDILLDGLFAAVAAIGFGAISDPPTRFRRGLVRGHTQQIEVSLPARAAHLPSDDRLHLLLVLSCEGVWIKQVVFSPRTLLAGLPGRVRRVVFH